MSRFDQLRANYVNQSRGLLRTARDQSGNAADFGFIGSYNNGTSAGLVRHAADGYFYLFDSLSTPSISAASADTITLSGLTASTLVLGAVNAAVISNKGSIINASTTLSGAEANYHSVSAASAAIVITLPPLSAVLGRYNGGLNGLELTFVKKDSSANTVTIVATSGDLLDGVSSNSIVLTQQFELLRIVFVGDTDVGWLQL